MIRWHRSSCIRWRRWAEAIQNAKEAIEYINTHFPGAQLQVYEELFGDFGMIHTMDDFESLAAVEDLLAQLGADEERAAIFSKGADLFIEGKTKDTLMASL